MFVSFLAYACFLRRRELTGRLSQSQLLRAKLNPTICLWPTNLFHLARVLLVILNILRLERRDRGLEVHRLEACLFEREILFYQAPKNRELIFFTKTSRKRSFMKSSSIIRSSSGLRLQALSRQNLRKT